MSQGHLILRMVSAILFIAAAVVFYNWADGNRTLELIALVFLVVGIGSLILTFVLRRLLDRMNKR
ncbi:hypothetical protein [Candidatus Desulforudis audaxviator]|uniref:Uncharacterized protein n=1 Tax=Desulforudis audaxviator (strain MP104C) TaxID=477974 RepID=B1I531_DESAP|nr:hypothetical protein [Candidatus Desulforudis audaxviator]ACA60060.1 hypothetical protein Daud_1558 [Candidatus Desulforudis audaxviator MP104C]AZK60098.1 hypothetical protein Daudx_1552 [Candidatus Desulforudis audaxviator]